jgi:hypothetical protein
MSVFTPCLLHCPVCRSEFNWHRGYGREIRCCCRECYQEAEWRRVLSILGKPYTPDPRRFPVEEPSHD